MTLQQFVSELSEDLRIKFTQLEQILIKAKEKCQEIIGECSLHIDFSTVGKFLDINHVKKWSYYRIMRVNGGKQEQVEWIGSCNNDVCRKAATEWQERKNKTKKFFGPLKRAEIIERILEGVLRGIPITHYTKSEPLETYCPRVNAPCSHYWPQEKKCELPDEDLTPGKGCIHWRLEHYDKEEKKRKVEECFL